MLRNLILGSLLVFAVLAGSQALRSNAGDQPQPEATEAPADIATLVVAGGCFWCVEADFDKVEGVFSTTSGYSGGHLDNPTYKQVVREDTGHYEVVEIAYDPTIVGFGELIEYFWRHVDPTDAGGQFCDRGDSYRTAIFVSSAEERAIAEASRSALNDAGVLPGDIVTPVLDLDKFWPAEGYHQDYYEKNPIRYRYYRQSCGRDKRVAQVWAGAESEGS